MYETVIASFHSQLVSEMCVVYIGRKRRRNGKLLLIVRVFGIGVCVLHAHKSERQIVFCFARARIVRPGMNSEMLARLICNVYQSVSNRILLNEREIDECACNVWDIVYESDSHRE